MKRGQDAPLVEVVCRPKRHRFGVVTEDEAGVRLLDMRLAGAHYGLGVARPTACC